MAIKIRSDIQAKSSKPTKSGVDGVASKISSKGKEKQKVPKPKVVLPEPELDEEADEDEEDEDEDEDEDEENGGVSEKGMMRLMELVGPEDLDEFELAQLGHEDEDEEDEGEEEEGEEEDDDEKTHADDDNEEDEEDDGEDEDENMDLGETSALLDDSIVVDTADADTLAVDELGSDVSIDEDAVPMRKVTTNNAPAMRVLTEGIRMTDLPWSEHMIIQSKETVTVDPFDDLQRETAFYKIALDVVSRARKLASKHDIPFSRPSDYYAEMVKSDEHMERVRSKLVDEAQSIKKSEAAKKQRDLKKYGKQIQIEKLKQREAEKKGFEDRVAGVKRKRKEGMEIGDEGVDDEFGIDIDDAIEGRGERGGSGGGGGNRRGGRGGGGKPKMPRQARDAKYSLGGSSRRSKQNTRESTNDFTGWNAVGSGKGGRGGGRGKRGASQRPGKSRRQARRS